MDPFFNPQTVAHKIAIQLYRAASEKAYEDGRLADTKDIAIGMVNQFTADMLASIDDEARFRAAKNIF